MTIQKPIFRMISDTVVTVSYDFQNDLFQDLKMLCHDLILDVMLDNPNCPEGLFQSSYFSKKYEDWRSVFSYNYKNPRMIDLPPLMCTVYETYERYFLHIKLTEKGEYFLKRLGLVENDRFSISIIKNIYNCFPKIPTLCTVTFSIYDNAPRIHFLEFNSTKANIKYF